MLKRLAVSCEMHQLGCVGHCCLLLGEMSDLLESLYLRYLSYLCNQDCDYGPLFRKDVENSDFKVNTQRQAFPMALAHCSCDSYSHIMCTCFCT